MQDLWYYVFGGQRQGPIPISDLGGILSKNTNPENVLLWRQGMQNWQKAMDVPEVKGFLPPNPPPIPAGYDGVIGASADVPGVKGCLPPSPPPISAGYDGVINTSEASVEEKLHPWRRYFARTLDMSIFCYLVVFLIALAFPSLFSGSQAGVSSQGTDALFSIVGAAAYAVFETFCLWAFGGTLGKFIYGISVSPESGSQFTFPIALKRSLVVWVKGMGLGIPLVNVITSLVAYQTLMKEGQSSWDQDLKTVIGHRHISRGRWVFIGLVWLAIISIYSLSMTL